ncbi:hypothetical protein DFR78_105122 [Halanaerobium sp. MA284_MarDTE_T2]|nr:hypothetical protein DFR78_105122 [Halanaerobium sp. MA284_MarDTE_T2]RCW88467.1 hypothetical protein DER71_104116 [Halanaerobium sp. DL-01]
MKGKENKDGINIVNYIIENSEYFYFKKGLYFLISKYDVYTKRVFAEH